MGDGLLVRCPVRVQDHREALVVRRNFNHPSFTGINTTVRFGSKGAPASGVGAVNAAGPGRMLEFGLKFLF